MPELPDVVVYLERTRALLGDAKLKRIRARCQTGGKLLADRALSRLLEKNWPRGIEDVE